MSAITLAGNCRSRLLSTIIALSIMLSFSGCSKETSAPTLEQKAENGCVDSCRELGENLFQGHNNYEKDLFKAARFFRAAAEHGDVHSQYRLGRMYFRGEGLKRDFTEAVTWTQKSAEAGHPIAQFNLARAYYYGEGLDPDYEKAREWYLKSAEQNDPVSQFRLGRMFYRGEGVYQDFTNAAMWYRESAELGYEKAQRALGEMYMRSEGVAGSAVEAFFWFSLASMQSDLAEESKTQVASMLTKKELEETTARALQFFLQQQRNQQTKKSLTQDK